MSQGELSFKVRADAQAAAAEIRKVAADLKSLGPAGMEAARGVLPLGGALGGAGTGLANIARISGAGRAALQNTSFQLGDMAVQLAAGTRPAQVMAQQLPQLLGGFGMMGGALGVVMPLLGTLAAIGIPVAMALGAMGDGAADAEERTKALAKTLEDAQAALDRARAAAERHGDEGLGAMVQRYGQVGAAVQDLVARLDQLERQEAQVKVDAALDEAAGPQFAAMIDQMFGTAIQGAGGAFAGQVAEIEARAKALGQDIADALADGATEDSEWVQLLRGSLAKVQEELELAKGTAYDPGTLTQLQAAVAQLEAARKAQDYTAVADALAQVQALLQASGAELDGNVIPQLTKAEDVARQAAFALGEGEDSAIGIATSGMADGIAAARAEAVGLAAQLGIALDAAVKIRAQQALDTMKTEFSPGGQAMQNYGSRAPGGTAEQRALERRNAPPPPPRTGSGSGARAGGGGLDRNSVAGLSAQGMAMLADLGIAQAAVAEKVRAGLMTVAEGQDAMARAKQQAANRLAELIARMDALGPAGQAAAETARQALAGLVPDIESVGGALQKNLVQTFEESFARSIATGKNHMTAFADHVKMELARAFTNRFVTPLITPLINSVMGLFPFAKGGVPGLPDLGAFTGQVVNKPTLFAMGGAQAGLMGEAGPEAILPLRQGPGGLGVLATGPGGQSGVLPLARGAGGALGVAVPDAPMPFAKGGVPSLAGLTVALPEPPQLFARGGGAGSDMRAAVVPAAPGGGAGGRDRPVSVVVNNHTPAKIEARERMTDGGLQVEILVEQVEQALADRKARGVGALAAVDKTIFGQTRRGR